MNNALILYHFGDPVKKSRVMALCRELGLDSRELAASEWFVPLGVLAGTQTIPPGLPFGMPSAGANLPDLIVFCRLGDEGLDRFLAAYKQAGIPVTMNKAILTPTNANWSAAMLVRDLDQERAAITRSLRSRQ